MYLYLSLIVFVKNYILYLFCLQGLAREPASCRQNKYKIHFFHKYNERQVQIHAKLVFGKKWKRDSLGGCNNLHKFPEENYVCNNSGFLTETCWCPFPCWLRIKTRFALQLSINVIKLILHCFGYPNMKEAWSHRLVLKLDFGHWMILDSGPISPWVNMRAIERSKEEKQMGFKQI